MLADWKCLSAGGFKGEGHPHMTTRFKLRACGSKCQVHAQRNCPLASEISGEGAAHPEPQSLNSKPQIQHGSSHRSDRPP